MKYMDNPEQEQTIHLTEYYHILLKRKWLILASLILVSTLTAFITFRMMPVYQATCIMVIEQERTTSPLTGERIEYDGWYTQSLQFSTHAKLITSRSVILQVIKKLKLNQPQKEKNLEISPIKAYFSSLKHNIRILLGQSVEDPTPRELQDRLINGIKSTINVETVEDTHLLNINTYSHDPDLAKNMANAVAKSYIEFNLENRISSSRSTLSWMSDQLYEIQKKLEDAEEEFLAFKQQEKLFSLEGRQEGIAGKIGNLNDIYIETRNRRLEADTKLKELGRVDQSRVDALHVRTLINNPLIESLYRQLLESEIELSRLSKVYKSKHPKISQIKSSIENAREKFRAEIQKEVKNLKVEQAILTQKELALKKTIEDFESDALTTNRKELKYTILQRNVDTHQRLYDILLQRIEESNITGDIDVSNIRIAEAAVTPVAPIKPNKSMQMMLGIILGLMTGIVLAFLREYLDKTLRTEEDIQRYLDLPVLAVVPEAEKGNYQPPKNPAPAEDPPMIINQRNQVESAGVKILQNVFLETYASHSSFAEAYRLLRTNIPFSSMDKRIQSFVVTSAVDNEGKTLTVANTAYTIAQSGKSVLMIDADLRKSTLSKIVLSSDSPGLTGLLSEVFSTEVNKGSLSEFQIGDLFRLLAMQKKTGVLSLSQENEKIELLFYSGQLVDLNWITRPEDEKLASVLIANRMITLEQSEQAFAQQKATGQKLGFILLNNGTLKKEELAGPLSMQMMEGLRKALGFNRGSFSFKDRPESDFEPSAFDPVDFSQIYKQLIIGEEPMAYLKQKINKAIVETHIKNLFLLPAGNIPPNPSELLSSDRMSFLLSILQKRFDLLVIDSPPIVPASDALLVASHVTGVLLVVKAGSANRDLVTKTVGQLRMAQVNIFGVALNRVDIKKPGYYKYYFKNYSNYYAEGK
jgi:uncharacterized protein involved in exopolysaccharide biosynthesis/Mrp family chromosome partitioning ATPase